eukprot:15433851-Alexandrium_andersonii.AAC.1
MVGEPLLLHYRDRHYTWLEGDLTIHQLREIATPLSDPCGLRGGTPGGSAPTARKRAGRRSGEASPASRGRDQDGADGSRPSLLESLAQ